VSGARTYCARVNAPQAIVLGIEGFTEFLYA
jgi:hypothetical protein